MNEKTKEKQEQLAQNLGKVFNNIGANGRKTLPIPPQEILPSAAAKTKQQLTDILHKNLSIIR